MLRRLLATLSAGALLAVIAPASTTAQTVTAATVVFTAGAKVCVVNGDTPEPEDLVAAGTWDPCDNDDHVVDVADFWAPVAPGAECGADPVLCEGPENVRYQFTTDEEGLGDQNFCAAVAAAAGGGGVTTLVNTGAPNDQCELRSTGEVKPGVGNLGPYCGWSEGRGVSQAKIGGEWQQVVRVRWVQSAGTLLPLIFSVGGDQPQHTVGVGATQTTGARPGSCGLDPSKDFAPTNSFATSGFSTASIPPS